MSSRNLTIDLSEYPRRDRSGDGPPVVVIPAWRKTPTAGPRPLGLKPEEINALIDQYFTDPNGYCQTADIFPRPII
jgi:hypothetical protein